MSFVALRRLLPRLVRLSGGATRLASLEIVRSFGVASAVVLGVLISGCGGGTMSGVKAGPISMTNTNGLTAPAVALSIGSKLNLSMTPSGDTVNAGVDWTVTCGGNPVTGSITNGACGTLSPAHTADGATTIFTAPSAAPIGATVTITATVTSNPSQSSTARLTVLSTPIAVAFASPATDSMEVSTATGLRAVVTNDPVGAGVIWTATCGSATCGSFNPTISGVTGSVLGSTTYTAPATVPVGAVVTVTATSLTDTTKSISATVTITDTPPPPPPPSLSIAVSVLPANIYVQRTGSGRSASLTALVSNDSAAAGVDWTLSCSTTSCGTISAHTASGLAATFNNTSNVPVGGTITITAKSTSDPTKSATAVATIVTATPVTVTMTGLPPATLTTGAQATLVASTGLTDIGNRGINWVATCGSTGACGSFNLSPAHTANSGQIVYTAPATVPAGNVVSITASSPATTPSNPAAAFITIVQAPPPPPTLSFAQAPPASMVSAATASVSVAVANDIAPGGVTWTVQCGNTAPGGCGWFAPVRTASGAASVYTAPPVTTTSTSVILTATSIADPTVSISTNPIPINPDTALSVSFIPSLPSKIQPNASVNLTAAVANDATSAGVDWQVCASGCGFFTTRPEIAAIPATSTTPYVPLVPAITATTVSAWPNGLPLPYTAPSQAPAAGSVAVVVTAHADGSKANSGSITISPEATGPDLNGLVQVGAQPVVGATVALFAAGTGGYSSVSTQVASASPTDKNGNFTLSAGYSCPQPGRQMYLVATGGKVGDQDANPNLALMTALGSCANLSSAPVALNETTTVASAFATAPFAADDALTGNSSYLYIGAGSGNLVGLANAFASVNNLVDISTGKVRYRIPTENAAVPYVEINTLADILNACASTAGGVKGDGSACSTLFVATDLLGTGTFGSSIAPSDTLQAAFNIAQHPVANYGYNLDIDNILLGLVTPASPLQPILTTQPNDWSISLNYTSGGGLSAASTVGSFAIDATGNLWITDSKAGSVIEWSPVGAALSPSTGLPAGGGPIAIDAVGNVWISGDGALTELTNLGSPLPWSPFGGVAGGGTDIAIDAQSNLWITNIAGVNEFSSLGLQLPPANGYTFDGITNTAAVGIDSSNNIWIGASGDGHASGHLAELTNPGGQLITSAPIASGAVEPQMAADSAGDIWFIESNQVCEATPYGGRGSTLAPKCYAPGGNTVTNGINVFNPRGNALDGAGTLWVANQGGSSLPTIPPGVLPVVPSGNVANAKSYVSSSLAAGPLRVAVDGSGNIWVLLSDNTVTEYVGAAVPVVTPVALGTQKNKLGAKP